MSKKIKSIIKNRMIISDGKCGDCYFFSVTTKKWAKKEYCIGYCCFPDYDKKLFDKKNCEYYTPNFD